MEALEYSCPGTNLNIRWLIAHLIQSEFGWMKRIGPAPGNAEVESLESAISWAGTTAYRNDFDRSVTGGPTRPKDRPSAGDLINLCSVLESEVSLPILSRIEDISSATSHSNLTTVEKALAHLLWHWTYHSGQIGLLRLLWGSDYEWKF